MTSITIVGFAQTPKQKSNTEARVKATPNETVTQKRTRIVKSSAAKSNKNSKESKAILTKASDISTKSN